MPRFSVWEPIRRRCSRAASACRSGRRFRSRACCPVRLPVRRHHAAPAGPVLRHRYPGLRRSAAHRRQQLHRAHQRTNGTFGHQSGRHRRQARLLLCHLAIGALAVYLCYRFAYSNLGRGTVAIRENRYVAQFIAVDPFRAALAFVLGAFLAGLAGGFYTTTSLSSGRRSSSSGSPQA